jgi:hypothetical protein
MAYRSLVGFGGCFNCGFPAPSSILGSRASALVTPTLPSGFGRFDFAPVGIGSGFRGAGRR